MQDNSTLAKALKIVYGPEIKNQIPNEIILWKLLRKQRTFTATGSAALVKVRKEDSQGFAGRLYTGTIPASGGSQFEELTVPLATIYGRIAIMDQTMKKANKQPGPLIKELDDEKKSILRATKKDINRQLYGDGVGRLATVAAFSAGSPATFTVDSTRNIKLGMAFDVKRAGADVTDAVNLTVTGVLSATQFTATVAGTPASGDIIVRQGAYQNEMQGLELLIDDDNECMGIDRSSNYWWSSNVLQNSGSLADLSLKKLRILCDQIYSRSDEEPNIFIGSPDTVSAYAFSMIANRRFLSEGEQMKQFDFGWKGVRFDGKPFVRDPDCTKNVIYALNTRDLFRTPLSELDWLDEDGQIIRLDQTSNQAKWYAVTVCYDNLCVDRSNSHGKLTNVHGLSEGVYVTE